MNSIAKPLEFRAGVWPSLMNDLRARGGGRRESGAFLLGRANANAKVVEDWLPYDVLDPTALNYEFVRLSTGAFPKLWAMCAARGIEVVGDVHTHPLGPGQSRSDRANPMISLAGHLALIVPRFAQGDIAPVDVSVNVYLGRKQWQSHFGQHAAALITVL